MSSGEHAAKKKRPRTWVVLTICAVAVLLAAGGFVAVEHFGTNAAANPTTPPPALTVTSVTPSGTNVDAGSTISVQFSTDLAPNSPMPTLSPPVAGSWAVLSPSLLQYQASGPLVPGASETITVPGGSGGVIGSLGQHMAQDATTQFSVAPGSTLRLQQLLAELGYLPVTFTPAAPVTSPAQLGNDQVGSFSWRWAYQPASLTTLWTPGTNNVITQGAVMNFESQNGLKTDGLAGPQVWTDLLADVQSGKSNAQPWGYVLVSQSRPETATVYKDGAEVYSTLVNTGVAGATTENGTWPVFARYTVTTMSGTNPDGSHYSDPGIPWVSYFHGGDALHGFVRPGYGYPQSDGCVEMPISNAAGVFPLTPLGTLVTVQA
ncbi:MAG TPA: L,D-transpeptidase family protein [Acidimicrobiales bacterium]|nr:L,D-transpeptidase family protein [Acidimicrobiales bacterium]